MFLLRFAAALLSLALLSACTTMKIEPIDTRHNLDQVCIKNCDQECFDADMLSVIKKGFERHGLSAQVYSGELPSDCLYHLTYYCERSWDLAMYMHHAELRLFHDKNQIGYAEFHLKGEGGFSFTKYNSTEEKMNPVIDKLLSDYPLVSQTE